MSVANNPVSKEVAESYNKRIEAILQKLIAKRGCDVDSFEVKEVVGEFGFVMKQFTQVKNEEGIMLAHVPYYRNEKIKPMIDEQYGKGASEFFGSVKNFVALVKNGSFLVRIIDMTILIEKEFIYGSSKRPNPTDYYRK